MMTFNQRFGSDRVTAAGNDTPQQKKFEKATGKDSDSAVGDVKKKVETPDTRVPAPSGVNKEVWASAEESALGLNGGFGGIGKEGRRIQVQEQYDKLVEGDKQTKEWAAGSGILGDIGEK